LVFPSITEEISLEVLWQMHIFLAKMQLLAKVKKMKKCKNAKKMQAAFSPLHLVDAIAYPDWVR
jgi:hypothetical protein